MSKKRTALLFPGQGAQSVGMGKEFVERYAIARETFEEANDTLGHNLSKILFDGPMEQLTETRNSQTGLFVTCFAAWRVLRQEFPDLEPVVGAGFSLGEYTAVAAGGWLSFSDTLKLVDFRGQSMQRACERVKGSMAAIIGLPAADVESLVSALQMPGAIWIANYNAPDQTVVSGTEQGIEAVMEAAKAKGARRAMPLNVHGAFHSGLMDEAEECLQGYLQECPFAEKGLPLVMNFSGNLVQNRTEVLRHLSRQMAQSVKWVQSIHVIEALGADLYLEVGCGKVLAGLNKRIGVKAPTFKFDQAADLDVLASS